MPVKSTLSLRARLIVAFVAIVVGVLALAAVAGIVRFDTMMSQQAETTAQTSMNVAHGLLTDEIADVKSAVIETSRSGMVGLADTTSPSFASDLIHQADLVGLTYLAVVSRDGTVRATSLGSEPYVTDWAQMKTWAASGTESNGLALVPEAELAVLGLDDDLQLEVKETPNGTVVAGEEQGALCIVAVSPIQGGAVVGVRVLKLRHWLVDSVVAKMGGTSTLFQGGVRISTTVRNAEGQRAVGTVVSDEVRSVVLEKGEPFSGEAFVVSREYITSYAPLRDLDDVMVGMLYVGVDKAPYAAATRAFAIQFGGVIALALALALVGALVMSHSLSLPLTAMTEAAGQIATGDLTVQVPAEGYREIRTLGQSFNAMTGALHGIIGQVDDSVRQLRSVAGEITAASRTSSEHASGQASSVAQTTATLEELTRSFQSVADGARRVLHVAEDALESAQGGMVTVDRAHDAMDQLAAGAQDMSNAASSMGAVTDEITEMTNTIAGIAGQTKILALNAAIEAARAGEAGRGFAVVSSEIRSLAETVAKSAARIADVVSGIQEASSRLQQAADRQTSLSDSSVASGQESREAFGLIVQQMEDTAKAAREIAEATVQQTRASDQLVDAMHQVSLSSTETAVAARQLTDSADLVEAEAENLLQGLTRFKTR